MANDDPESRPIPVSELLARQREAAEASALTGEIPRVAFPRSANPVAQRATRPQSDSSAASRTASGMPWYTPVVRAEPTDEEANRVTGIIPPVDDAPTAATPQTATPRTEAPTAAVDIESGPATGSFLRTDEDVDFESYRNFEDVVGGDEEPKKRKRGLFGRRKGNGGGSAEKQSAGQRARAARRATRPAGPSDAEIAAAAESAAETAAAAESVAETAVVEPAEPVKPIEPVGTVAAGLAASSVEETTALAPVEPDDVYEDQVPVVDRPLVDPVTGRFAPRPTTTQPAAPRVDRTVDTPAIVPSATRRGSDPSAPPRSRTAEPEAGTDDAAPAVRKAAVVPRADRAESEGGEVESRAARRRRTRGATDTPVSAAGSDTTVVDEGLLASKHSPAMQWLILAGQAIAGLVLGAAGFWGFVQLWRWNVSFALVLSAVVIFGIVTLVHLVRRRHDLATTLLALGVGLLITLGPLILLATS